MNLRQFIEAMKTAGLKAEVVRSLALEKYSNAQEVDTAVREFFPDFTPSAKAEEKTPAQKTAEKVEIDNARAICEICELGGASEKAVEYVRSGKTLEAIRAEIIESRKTKQSQFSAVSVETDRDIEEKRGLLADGLALRAGFPRKDIKKADEVEKAGFRGLTLADIARECLQLKGENVRLMNTERLAERALGAGTGDFTNILANVASKFMAIGYEQAPTSYQLWAGVGSLTDFKSSAINQISGFSALPEIQEGAPMKSLSLADSKELAQLKTYGGYFTISRQAIINDDLGAFTRVPMSLANASRRKINSLAYGVLNTNANMSDGVALFHGTHANLGTTGVISNTTIGELDKLLGLAVDSKSNKLNVQGKYFLVPKTKKSLALQYLSQMVPVVASQASNADVFRGMFEVIADAELDGGSTTAYYLVASPSAIDTVTVFFLNGVDTPSIREADSVVGAPQGRTFEVFIDVVAKAIDWRGMAKNIGA